MLFEERNKFHMDPVIAHQQLMELRDQPRCPFHGPTWGPDYTIDLLAGVISEFHKLEKTAYNQPNGRVTVSRDQLDSWIQAMNLVGKCLEKQVGLVEELRRL